MITMTVQQEKQMWTDVWNRTETQESLSYLIEKLPDVKRLVEAIEPVIHFSKAVLEDEQTINQFENRLSAYPINGETIEAGIELLGKLPMLLQHVAMLEQLTVFVQDVLGDEQSLEQIKCSIESLPLVQEGKALTDVVKEVKERAATQPQEPVSIFTLMKWLKDPSVQKGLHFAKTTLDILGEKQR